MTGSTVKIFARPPRHPPCYPDGPSRGHVGGPRNRSARHRVGHGGGREDHAPGARVSGRPGIDTAVTTTDTPLLVAPFPEAEIVQSVPEGEAVILTGATAGDYDAASHDGAGGWIDKFDIIRKFQR